jgi:hypothetical protein
MPASADGLRFPYARVLLPRVRLAYVHLQNLLSDATRERASRVFGYVAIWLEKELLLLYLQEGELVTATVTADGRTWSPIAIREALHRVPAQPEFGHICFHEASDDQLACMHAAQVMPEAGWPPELAAAEPRAIAPYLMATLYDGLVEVAVGDELNYVLYKDGTPKRAFLATPVPDGAVDERVSALLDAAGQVPTATGEMAVPRLRRWGIPPAVPNQASPRLIDTYRALMRGIVDRLVFEGSASAPAVAEQARGELLATHPVLQHFPLDDRPVTDPVAGTAVLTRAVAAWTRDVLLFVATGGTTPEQILADVGRERRHLLQSAGFWDALPWRPTW